MQVIPLQLRDFSRGVIRKSSVNEVLVPQNSVAHSINFNYDTTIGKATVRPGTTLIGATVVSGKNPLGISEYVSSKGTAYNNLIVVYSGASTATVYYYNGSWAASNVTNLSNTAVNRFSMLGNQIFRTNGVTAMQTSSDGGATWGTTNSIDSGGTIKPTLIIRSKARLLASGDTSQSPSRVFFSSVIDPTTTPGTITWATNSATGDWIDVNPDDGDVNTAFAETSNVVLVFKNKGIYRLDVISKTVDTLNLFNIGTPSQECVVNCQGVIYFFTGIDIRRTAGDLPEQISRLGVQDWIDAIPQSNWTKVSAGTDGLNVYFNIGTVTLNTNQDDQKTYTNVVLKFSTRDESWSVHSYQDNFGQFCQYTNPNGTDSRKMVGADYSGDVQTINKGTTDNGTAIYYELQTQEQEIGNRGHLKKISDQIVVYGKGLNDAQIQVREGDGNFKDIQISLDKRVNIGEKINLEDYFFTFRCFGNSSNTSPIFEGIYIEKIEDRGITKK